jgi:ribosomal protein S15P/S13E
MPKKSTDSENKIEESEKKETISKKLSNEEYEKRVIELAKEGLTSEKIGELLRKEGTHTKDYNKKISKILKEKELYSNPDLKNIEKKLESLDKHFQNNKQDKKAKKDREKIYGNYRKLKGYFGLLNK